MCTIVTDFRKKLKWECYENKKHNWGHVTKEEFDYLIHFFESIEENRNGVLTNKWRPIAEYFVLLRMFIITPYTVIENNESLGKIIVGRERYQCYTHVVVSVV